MSHVSMNMFDNVFLMISYVLVHYLDGPSRGSGCRLVILLDFFFLSLISLIWYFIVNRFPFMIRHASIILSTILRLVIVADPTIAMLSGSAEDAVGSAPYSGNSILYQLVWVDFKGMAEATFDGIRILPMVIDRRSDFPSHQLLKLFGVDARSIGGPPILQQPVLVSTIAKIFSP